MMQRYNLNVELSYARGVAQTGYRDVNLRTDPRFTLTNEGDRPVFVDASTIVPLTGATSFLASRVEPTFGQVLVTSSDTRSDSKQLTVSFGGLHARGDLQRRRTRSRGRRIRGAAPASGASVAAEALAVLAAPRRPETPTFASGPPAISSAGIRLSPRLRGHSAKAWKSRPSGACRPGRPSRRS